MPLHTVLRGVTHESRNDDTYYPRGFNRALLLGDETGDGLSDLLIEWTHRELQAFVGVSGPDLFAGCSQNLSVVVPNDEEYTWLTDLDRDGKQDIVRHHQFTLRDAHGAPTQPPGTEPHRVVTLFAQ